MARAAGCDCVHPGYGFLSESEAFAQAVIDAGLVWVGPPPDAIRRMGVKTEARALMEAAGVPLVPGYQGGGDERAFLDSRGAHRLSGDGQGGGRRRRQRDSRRRCSLPICRKRWARRGARRSTLLAIRACFWNASSSGRGTSKFRCWPTSTGNTVHLFERECSAQRRHQKVIEESPSPLLDAELRARMGAAGVAAAQAVGYVNAGTVEFIATPDGEFYFLEMNTRLQVEHPVTELVTGLDLVKLQFAIAAGDPLPFAQDDLTQRGHAIECRLYAEDAAQRFSPGGRRAAAVSRRRRASACASIRASSPATPSPSTTIR